MEKREEVIKLWFDMWLQKADLGILDILFNLYLLIMRFILKAGVRSIKALKKSSIGLMNGTHGEPFSNGI